MKSLSDAKAAVSQPLNDFEMKNVTPTNPFTTWRHDSTRDWRVLKLPFLFLIREKVVKPERNGSIAIQKIYLILLKELEYYRLYHKQNNKIINCTKTVHESFDLLGMLGGSSPDTFFFPFYFLNVNFQWTLLG
jgi:hypothetical protein